MKVILDLSKRALSMLGKKAKEMGRSRKKHMEIILTAESKKKQQSPLLNSGEQEAYLEGKY